MVELTGHLYNNAGTGRTAATAYAFATSLAAGENTNTASAAASDATDAAGQWTFSALADNTYDIRIDDGSSKRWRRYAEEVQYSRAQLGFLHLTERTDGASVQAAILEGNRATPTAGDEFYFTMRLSDSAGNQDEFARLSVVGVDITTTTEDGRLDIDLLNAGTLQEWFRLHTGHIEFTRGMALASVASGSLAALYAIGRNADVPNFLQINVPTGASLEISVNEVAVGTLSASGLDLAAGDALSFGTVNILVDNPGGTMTLSNVDALDVTTEATIEAAIDTLGNLTSAAALATVGTIGTGVWQGTAVGVAYGGTGAITAAAARTALGVAIGSDVQAWDAFLDDIGALVDPNADRLMFWDDSVGDIVWLTVGGGLTITGTTITAAAATEATQADMEDAGVTNPDRYVSPEVAKYAPSACKAWVVWAQTSGTPTINTSYNVTSLTDNAVGDLTVNFTTAFSSANYTMTSGCQEMGFVRIQDVANRAAGSCRLRTLNSSFAAVDGIAGTSAEFFGDQ